MKIVQKNILIGFNTIFQIKTVGIEKSSAGKWVYSSSRQFLSTSIWLSGQPNDDGNCVSVTGEKWFDGACSYERFSVCEF